jgi:hypothetical protein
LGGENEFSSHFILERVNNMQKYRYIKNVESYSSSPSDKIMKFITLVKDKVVQGFNRKINKRR